MYPLPPKSLPVPKSLPAPSRVTLLIEGELSHVDPNVLKKGNYVRTGQKILLSVGSLGYAISSVTGRISDICSYTGEFRKRYVAVCIDTAAVEDLDDAFGEVAANPNLGGALEYLVGLPGNPPLSLLAGTEKSIHSIVIQAEDKELMVDTNRFIITNRFESLKKGVRVLKEISGISNILVVTSRDRIQAHGELGAEVKAVDRVYPSAFPVMILKELMDLTVPAGKTPEDLGVALFSAESVAAMGEAFSTGRIPVHKIVTLIRKDGSRSLFEVRVGSPIQEIVSACGESMADGDRIILGGPLTGRAVYSEEMPVGPDTDAVMLQDKTVVPYVSDYPCINCGECVRVCPAHVPINMLVRFLEARAYESAAEEYDLYSCIECGLCSYVCVASIPVFQYIRLAKDELRRLGATEEPHV